MGQSASDSPRWAFSRGTACIVAIALMGTFVTACGDDDGENGGGGAGTGSVAETTANDGMLAAAKEKVDQASQPISKWDGFGGEVSPPSGKRVVAIECSSLGVGCVQGAKAVKEAGAELGWKTDIVNGKGDPTVWNAAVKNAVASKADGIVLLAISPALVKDGIAEAKSAGIPVVSAFVGPKADAMVATDPKVGGEAMAAYLADASKGRGKFLVLNDAEFPIVVERFKVMVDELKSMCPDCKVKTADFTFATMVTKLPGQVASAIQADPDIDFVVAPFDASIAFVRQGLQRGGGKAKIASFEGDPDVMKTIGDGVMAADMAGSNVWAGWQSLDNLVRAMLDEPVVDTPMPQRLFTAANKEAAANWEGDFDFRTKYRQLWGKG